MVQYIDKSAVVAEIKRMNDENLFEFERGIDLNIYPDVTTKGWHCSYMPNNIEDMKKDKFKLITSGDNLIDACYEMILKLHEQKLL